MSTPKQIKVSGKKFTIEKSNENTQFEKRPGGWLVAIDSKGKRTRIAVVQNRNQLSFSLDGFLYHGEVIAQTRAGVKSSSDQDLISQFPGKIRKVMVKKGDLVKEGDPLLVMEAMKMEFQIKAPSNGQIEQIHVTENMQVTPGTKFLDLKESPS